MTTKRVTRRREHHSYSQVRVERSLRGFTDLPLFEPWLRYFPFSDVYYKFALRHMYWRISLFRSHVHDGRVTSVFCDSSVRFLKLILPRKVPAEKRPCVNIPKVHGVESTTNRFSPSSTFRTKLRALFSLHSFAIRLLTVKKKNKLINA